jgi:hypothetical protein
MQSTRCVDCSAEPRHAADGLRQQLIPTLVVRRVHDLKDDTYGLGARNPVFGININPLVSRSLRAVPFVFFD